MICTTMRVTLTLTTLTMTLSVTLYSLCLLAMCRGTWIDIDLQISYTLADVKKKVESECNLDSGSYTMEYRLMGEKFVINTDEDLSGCIERWKRYLKKSLIKPLFCFHVLPFADQPHVVDKQSPTS